MQQIAANLGSHFLIKGTEIVKASSLLVLVIATILLAGALAASPNLDASQSAPATATGNQPQNLKVLPKDMTTRQVRDVMDGWTDALGVDCSTCHIRNATPAADGRPHYNYADDSKQEKRTARVMYAMTQEINAKYLSTVPNSGIPVSCGTCHRGHLSPEPFSPDDDAAAANAGGRKTP